MTEVTPEALAAARAQLAEVDTGLHAEAAGVYGDPAGAAVHSEPQTSTELGQDLQAKGAVALSVDTGQLLAQVQAQAKALEELQAQVKASQPAPAAPAVPLTADEIVHGTASPSVHHAFSVVEARLQSVERKLGLRKDDTTAE